VTEALIFPPFTVLPTTKIIILTNEFYVQKIDRFGSTMDENRSNGIEEKKRKEAINKNE